MVVAGLAAVAVGLPALRIPGMFFAVTTLALSVPVATWLLNPTYFESLTPSSIDRPHLLDRYELDSPLRWYYLCLAALGAALVVVRRFRGTRPGRAVARGPRQRARRRRVLHRPNRIRLVAFALSGMLAGLAGGLYVVTLRSVPFNGFSPNASIELFTMVVIGGLGSLPGAILGAAYVWSAQFFLHGATQLLATGAGLLLLLMFVPGGVGQLVFNVRDRYLRWVAIAAASRSRASPATPSSTTTRRRRRRRPTVTLTRDDRAPRRRCCAAEASTPPTARCPCCSAWTSTWARARSSRCSARTAPVSRPCCAWSPDYCPPPLVRSPSTAPTSPD